MCMDARLTLHVWYVKADQDKDESSDSARRRSHRFRRSARSFWLFFSNGFAYGLAPLRFTNSSYIVLSLHLHPYSPSPKASRGVGESFEANSEKIQEYSTRAAAKKVCLSRHEMLFYATR